MKFFLTTIAALTLALAPAPRAAAQGHAEREKKIEKQAEGQGEESPIERSTAADKSVVVSVCVASGDVVVHGWDRAEVRARASEAGGLRLLTPPNVPSAPRVDVLVSDERDAEPSSGECGSAGTLEVTVPRGASVNVKAQSGDVEVADVAGVRVNALSGDVDLRRVSKSVEVSSLSGDVSLSDSSGPVRVTAVSGSVEARNVRASAAGDAFEAKSTSGDVMLEGVAHAQVRGVTVSGGVNYTGALARGGDYDFTTISGDVTLELPASSSFSLHAKVVMGGDIVTDFPVKTSAVSPATPATPPPAGPPTGAPPHPPVSVAGMPPQAPDWRKPGKNKPPKEPMGTRLDGTVGTGDAVVNLSSFSGSLYLRKR
jgi:hypothetical protein